MSTQLMGEQLFNGLVLGSMYGLMASGISLIWGSLKMLNFCHGELYMLGGYAIYFLLTLVGLPVPLAVVAAVLMVLLLSGLVERLVVSPLLNKPGWDVNPVIATLGMSIFLQNLALRLWGEQFKNVPYFAEGVLSLGGMHIAKQRLLILVVAASVILVGALLLKRSRWGMAMRGAAQDRDAAVLMGVNIHAVYTWTYAISGGLAALAATMLAPIFSVNPWMGTVLVNKALIVCVLGGLGNLEGAILGGVVLGTVESLTVIFWSSQWKEVTAFALMLGMLWVRPSGLLGSKGW